MPAATDYPAKGHIRPASANGTVVFLPANTSYELHLALPDGAAAPPAGPLTLGLIRATARKIWTVPSGGNFIAPIFGPPKIIQGRVKYIDDSTLVVHAGAPILVALPPDNAAIDLARGPLALGALVNVTAFPGATFQPVPPQRH